MHLTEQSLAKLLGRDALAQAGMGEPRADGNIGRIVYLHHQSAEKVSDQIGPALHRRPDALTLASDFFDHRGPRFAALRNALFASGYLPLKEPMMHGETPSVVYALSSRLADPRLAGAASRHKISIPHLQGRFANHLWQYLFLNLYGLWSGATIHVQSWIGEEFFGLKDEVLYPEPHLALRFFPFDPREQMLWKQSDPVVDAAFEGYFQSVPALWRAHREYIRRLFSLRPRWDEMLQETTARLDRDNRTLISIHVRRGDYGSYDRPEFQITPVKWYREKLRELWPRTNSPILHVSTDDPKIIPEFSDFEMLGPLILAPMERVPHYIRDFYLLREAQIMLACNSSYSCMAALLAREQQQCFLPNFEKAEFEVFNPWEEEVFWNRFSSAPGGGH